MRFDDEGKGKVLRLKATRLGMMLSKQTREASQIETVKFRPSAFDLCLICFNQIKQAICSLA